MKLGWVEKIILLTYFTYISMEQLFLKEYEDNKLNRLSRVKREASPEVETKLGSERKRLELYLICDKDCYDLVRLNYGDPKEYFYNVALEADSKFAAVSAQLFLVGMEFWNVKNRIAIHSSLSATRRELQFYRKNVQLPKVWSDFTLLFTGFKEASSTLGVYAIGQACNSLYSTGVISYTPRSAFRLSQPLVHEMVHGLKVYHDSGDCCEYGRNKCLMATVITSYIEQHSYFSKCTKDQIASFLNSTSSFCLYNEPEKVFTPDGRAACGNGIIEEGEECDCGQGCLFECCNCCENCQLKPEAECAMGSCCNTTSCKFLGADTVCSSAKHEFCDIDHVCDGENKECPIVFPNRGEDCIDDLGNHGYCKKGRCLTRSQQCKDIYNANATNVYTEGSESCYNQSLNRANVKSHCGLHDGEYLQCTTEREHHYMCGLLQCTGPDVRLNEVTSTYRYPSKSYINGEFCLRSKHYDWSVKAGEPQMVENGVPCMQNGACYHGNCLNKTLVFQLLSEENETDIQQVSQRNYCGDGFVDRDSGEECDCGPEQCSCCNFDTCKISEPGTSCHNNECLVCDGQTYHCTGEEATDFRQCDNEDGRCYKGDCVSLKGTCEKYFGSQVQPSYDLYVHNTMENNSYYNGGGYILRAYGSNDWSNSLQEFVRAQDDDGVCGLLLCESNVKVSKKTVEDILGYRFGQDIEIVHPVNSATTSALYYPLETFSDLSIPRTFYRYFPITAESGTPCKINSIAGYCMAENLKMDTNIYGWYWYSSCVPIEDQTKP